MVRRVDIAVYSSGHKLILIGEIKASSSFSGEWAAKMRRNLLAHSLIPKSPFFMIVSHEKIFLWVDQAAEDVLPQFTADTHSILSQYFQSSRTKPKNATEYSLEIAVASWLSDIISSPRPDKSECLKLKIVYESGLFKAIRGGSVVMEALL